VCNCSTASGAHLWAENFDGTLAGLFDFQDRITASIVGLIEPQIRQAEVERARRKRPENLDAYDLYHRALPAILGVRVTQLKDYDESIELLGRAVELEPDFASALALAAWAHEKRLTRGGIAPPGVDDAARAIELAERALVADGSDSFIVMVAGVVALTIKGEEEVGAALEIWPALTVKLLLGRGKHPASHDTLLIEGLLKAGMPAA
jgi:tetratricopeptide (TPR) repeat protein